MELMQIQTRSDDKKYCANITIYVIDKYRAAVEKQTPAHKNYAIAQIKLT